jgi:putative aminopeptidase FrvX
MKHTEKQGISKTLEGLCAIPGISGFEKESGISEYLFETVKSINPNTVYDSFGNIVSVVGEGSTTILVEAHMDEVGFVVCEIDPDIILCPRGVMKGEVVSGSRLFVVGKNISGDVILREGEYVFSPSRSNLEKVEKGDVLAFERVFSSEGDVVYANSLDNRIGCSVLIEVLQRVRSVSLPDTKIVFVFSIGEETDESEFSDILGRYGDDFAIVVDAAYAQPVNFGTADTRGSIIPRIGEGCALQVLGKGFSLERELIEMVEGIAEVEGIPLQRERAPEGYGKTNYAKMLQQGVKRGIVVNIPARDQHQQRSCTNINDAVGAVRLIVAFLTTSSVDI